MIKVVPYIQTIGSEMYKKFILLPFSVNLLYPTTTKEEVQILFDGWHGKNMGTYCKFYNEEHVVLEFYAGHYTFCKNMKKDVPQKLPLPQIINDFINDMDRLKIQLYWTEWIDLNFEPKDYLEVNKIEEYFTHLLIRMQKDQDLD